LAAIATQLKIAVQQIATGGLDLKYPHLLWAITNWGAHYRLAQAIGRSEARLSRCLAGRTQFTIEERAELSRVIGFPEAWLFEEINLPARSASTRPT
jgi:hypothetical protein